MSILPATNLYPQSSIAGFNYYQASDNSLQWRILYQKNDGSIRGMVGDSDSADLVGPGIAKLGTPIASVSFKTATTNGSHNFYLNNSNEVCVASVRFTNQGPLKDPSGNTFKARPDSRLGVFVWVVNNTPHLRLAYQLTGGEVQQINWDGNPSFAFTYAGKSPPTMGGTSLAFLNQSPLGVDQYFRGYYQHSNNTIMELVNEPSNNYIGTFNQNLTSKTRITANYPAMHQSTFQRGQGQVGVYWVNPDSTVSKCLWANGAWGAKQDLPNTIRVAPNSDFMVFSWVPANSLSPVKERIIWVGTDGKMHAQYL